MSANADKGVHPQTLKELHSILKQPYKDVCANCFGAGMVAKTTHVGKETCPSCKGSGYRLLRLL